MRIKIFAIAVSFLLLASCNSVVEEASDNFSYQAITEADLASDQVMVSAVDQESGEIISFRDEYFTFGFPSSAGWRFSGLTDDGAVHILVPDEDYEVFLNFKVTRLADFQEVDESVSELTILSDGVELYRIPFGGIYDLAYINADGKTYELSVSVESSEPTPEDLDGVWMPSTNVAQEELWLFYQTAQLY